MAQPAPECPCGSGRRYAECCGRRHEGEAWAETAEALMRSRYSAYVLGKEAYLLSTWHASTRPATLDLAAQPAPKWIGLRVLRHEQQDETHAVVEFVARYKVNGRAYKMQEASRFVKEDGRWFYVEGDTEPDTP
ncbi:MAG: YchJ family metal-binding protein [Pseudomonadota bacterium]